jgi:putative ABC transport system substrate-binding protein
MIYHYIHRYRHIPFPYLVLLVLLTLLPSCSNPSPTTIPTIGFVQYLEDPTINEARTGFYDALREAGFSEDSGNVKIIYRNAQLDQATLGQIVDYFVAHNVDAIAANTTLSMITASNKTKSIPIFMMVAPSPELAGLTTADSSGRKVPPPNLFGTYETLDYIDTSVSLAKVLFPSALRIGTIYNSSEPNSVNAMERLQAMTARLGLTLVALPVTASNETQQVTEALADKGIDLFFALPDNVIFSSFETVYKIMSVKKIPILTSEAGLVKRGAFAAYGADMYQWGHQAGVSAAEFLKSGKTSPGMLQLVTVRKRIYNPKSAADLGLAPPAGFEALK